MKKVFQIPKLPYLGAVYCVVLDDYELEKNFRGQYTNTKKGETARTISQYFDQYFS